MNLFEQLNKISKEAQEAKLNQAKQQAEKTFKKIETMLSEVAKEGKTEFEYHFYDEEASKKVRQEIKKLLENQGLAVELSYRNMLISWQDKDFRRPWPGEIVRWYDLVNTTGGVYDIKVSYSGTNFEEVKAEMSNYNDCFRGPGTGQIVVNIITIEDGNLEKHSFKVFEK